MDCQMDRHFIHLKHKHFKLLSFCRKMFMKYQLQIYFRSLWNLPWEKHTTPAHIYEQNVQYTQAETDIIVLMLINWFTICPLVSRVTWQAVTLGTFVTLFTCVTCKPGGDKNRWLFSQDRQIDPPPLPHFLHRSAGADHMCYWGHQ